MKKKKIEEIFLSWPNFYITSREIRYLLDRSPEDVHVIVSRALKKQSLTRVKNGLYIINPPYRKKEVSKFELAQNIYTPSFISLESSLSYHNWIPEAVYATTSVATKRAKHFETPLGNFRFYHVPSKHFLMNVKRVVNESSVFLLAEPWRALADYIYVHQKKWQNLQELEEDMRIEKESLLKSNFASLNQLHKHYPKSHVRKILLGLFLELKQEKSTPKI